jgi:purine-binding chemotaxis protein CheW
MSGVHVRVRAGGEHYALPVEAVTEVAELGDVTPVPGAPAEVIGVRNLRGQVIPVIDLAAKLGLDNEGGREWIVVAQHAERRAGLAVDGIEGIEDLPDAHEEGGSEYLAGAALVNGELVGIVRVEALFDALTPVEDA